MSAPSDNKISRFLSLVLRHQPQQIGLVLDAQGWCSVDELIARCATAGLVFDRARLRQMVAANDKQRFTLSEDGERIRAAQGHSVEVTLGLSARTPPDRLYHGTATRFLAAILAEGLKPMQRQQVHLSADVETAVCVGQRHGEPVVLVVDANRLHAAGGRFEQAENGVWLSGPVAPAYLSMLEAPPA